MSVTIVNNMNRGGQKSHILYWPVGMCGWDADGDPIVRTTRGAIGVSRVTRLPLPIGDAALTRDLDRDKQEYLGIQNPSGTCTITFT